MSLEDNPKDMALWTAFKNGDQEAFRDIFRLYYSGLFLYGLKLTKNKQLLEDTIQELFTDLYTAKTTTGVKSVKAYLFRSFQYKLFNNLKKDKRNSNAENVNDYSFEVSRETLWVSEETSEEKKNKIIELLSKLSKRQREIIYLRFYRNMSYEDISELMHINYQASRNLLSNSLKSLRELLLHANIVLCMLVILFMKYLM